MEALIELAKQPTGSGWSAARREQLFQNVLARVHEERAQEGRRRRRVKHVFMAGAAAAAVVGLLVGLASVGVPWLRGPVELAHKAVRRHHAAQ